MSVFENVVQYLQETEIDEASGNRKLIANPKSQIRNRESGIANPELEIRNRKLIRQFDTEYYKHQQFVAGCLRCIGLCHRTANHLRIQN